MDQDAFRQILGAAPPTPSSSSTQPRSRFGQARPKPATPAATKGVATDFKPRKANPKPKKAPDGSLYRDRAAERRAGKDGDFAGAEKLLEDFKARAGDDDEDPSQYMQYLGGDAEHTVLVKGLDHALLERMKHEQARKAEAELDDVEDELDRTLSSARGAAAPVEDDAAPKKAKTRDELIAELKARKAGAAGGEEGRDARFKPVGGGAADKGKGKEKEGAAPLGAGWKKLGAPAPAAAAGTGEKKLRKKKKKVVDPAPAPAASTSTSSSAPSAPAAPASAPVLPPASAPAPPAFAPDPLPDFDDDDDIFGDAGEYKGLESDSDSDADAAPKPAAPPAPVAAAAAASSKRKYFSDDDSDTEGISTAPSAVTDLAAKQAAANAVGASRRRGGQGEGEEDEEEEDVPMRLEGLSGRGPSARDLLEMDKAAEAEEQRKAKKLKYQAKAEEKRALRESRMTDADKANRDYQEMMNHLAKKDGKGGSDIPE
ncbi:hypothetical protein JCM10207_004252 [Rhodosporidiobolus poonsookiae]